jgi:hypothetical protein
MHTALTMHLPMTASRRTGACTHVSTVHPIMAYPRHGVANAHRMGYTVAMTDTEKAQALTDTLARINQWSAMPRTEHRTRALRSLRLTVRALQGQKVPAWLADSCA